MFAPCILIPTYDNPNTVREVVLRVREYLPNVVVIDDGSGPQGREAVASIGREGLARVFHREKNGGKGAAVKSGFAFAHELGFTHALQVDADGQHALADIPRFLDIAKSAPEALILGEPEFDESAPIGRRIARKITVFWTNRETGGRVIHDPMCGFRVYPVVTALRVANPCGDRMDFDPEIAVRIAWTGAPVLNVPTRVRYISRADGGVSHFKLVLDNWLITRMHSRLMWHRVSCMILGRTLTPSFGSSDS